MSYGSLRKIKLLNFLMDSVLMCLLTSLFCQTSYYLSIFRFERKIMELDFANKFNNMTS